MPIDDLFKALQMYSNGVQEFAQTSAISKATEEISKIRSAQMKEADKRAQLQSISDGLVAKLAGAGTPATTIQAVAGAMAPAPIQNVAQAASQAAQATNPEAQQFYGNVAQTIDTAEKAGEMQMQKAKEDWQANENALQRDLQRELAGIKAKGKNKLVATEIKDITQLDNEITKGQDIYNMYKKDPTLVGILEGRIPLRGQAQQKFADFQARLGRWSDAYRVRVTGAGAPMKELDMLLSRLPQGTDSRPRFEGIMKGVLAEGLKTRTGTLRNLSNAEKDVSRFIENNPFKPLEAELGLSNSQGKAPAIKRFKAPDGNVYEAQVDENGKPVKIIGKVNQ